MSGSRILLRDLPRVPEPLEVDVEAVGEEPDGSRSRVASSG